MVDRQQITPRQYIEEYQERVKAGEFSAWFACGTGASMVTKADLENGTVSVVAMPEGHDTYTVNIDEPCITLTSPVKVRQIKQTIDTTAKPVETDRDPSVLPFSE